MRLLGYSVVPIERTRVNYLMCRQKHLYFDSSSSACLWVPCIYGCFALARTAPIAESDRLSTSQLSLWLKGHVDAHHPL